MHFFQSIRTITSFIMHMERWMSYSLDKERARLCRNGLIELRTNIYEYDAHVQAAAFFRDELLMLLTGKANDDVVFALIEDLAVIMREKALRCPMATSGEKRIFEYFEQSGNWEIEDGTLVSMFYYVYIPAAVERDRTCRSLAHARRKIQPARKPRPVSGRSLAMRGY